MSYTTLSLIVAAVSVTLAIAYVLRTRRDYQRTFDELPTGLCVLGQDGRVQWWNQQMSAFTGIDADRGKGSAVDALPAPWSKALAQALAEPDGGVVKYALEGDTPRWIILHASKAMAPIPGDRRLILVEDITDYQRLQDELLHKERLASIGRLAAGIAHEIGNPVTGIACVAQNLAESHDPEDIDLAAGEILKQTQRISRTVSSLMQFSHPGSVAEQAQCVPCNLADCVDEAIHLLSLDREATANTFDNRCDRESLVLADNQLLLQVFVNLLDNARSAAAGEGSVTVDAINEGGRICVTIENPGESVPPEVLAQAFEPFFTTKDVGAGTGLGLPLVRSMLEDMGGSITLRSPAPSMNGRGACAVLHLSEARYSESFAAP